MHMGSNLEALFSINSDEKEAKKKLDPKYFFFVGKIRKYPNYSVNSKGKSVIFGNKERVSTAVVDKKDTIICCSRKRKRKRGDCCVSGGGDWMYKVSCDQSIGSNNTTGQKKEKMHPNIYNDLASSEKLRHNHINVYGKDIERKSLHNPEVQKSSLYGTQRNRNIYQDGQCASTTKPLPGYLVNNRRRIRVTIGPQHQADVPEWTGKAAYEVDSKFLGSDKVQITSNDLVGKEPLGKGRVADLSGSDFQGFLESVRSNVFEKRKRLKLELGFAFYLWGFNRMGEETVVSWTKEQEKKFKETWNTSRHLSVGNFWKDIVKVLPRKNRVSIVSYYFNVFLLRRREYQNRVSPNNVNSDDDESDRETC